MCNNCEYKCKKHETLIKHMNSKNDNHKCNMCSMRYDNTNDLKKYVDKDHSDAVNDKSNTNKKIKPQKYREVKEHNSRCSQCGYILYTEDTNEEQGPPRFYCNS